MPLHDVKSWHQGVVDGVSYTFCQKESKWNGKKKQKKFVSVRNLTDGASLEQICHPERQRSE